MRDFVAFRYIQLPKTTGKLLTYIWRLCTIPRAKPLETEEAAVRKSGLVFLFQYFLLFSAPHF